ncbi:MAG: 50S ribosomal protein L29 [Thermoproteota archaeon]|nr:50S ribosomal protein L29 [Thermoproteota archaeon]
MTKIKMKAVREMNEKDLRDRVEQMRTELMKLRLESSKGTLRKESGKLKPVRKNVARLLTRLNEMKSK